MHLPRNKSLAIDDKEHILIVDKQGFFGQKLVEELSKEQFVVVLSRRNFSKENVFSLPFFKKIPRIPKSTYKTIILIDDETSMTKDMIETFLKKSAAIQAQFIFCTSLYSKNKDSLSHFSFYYKKQTTLVCGDIFDNFPFRSSKALQAYQMIQKAKKEKRILLSNDGLQLLYPASFSDATSVVVQIVSEEKVPTVLYTFSQTPITAFGFARQIKKIDPLVAIDFQKQKTKEKKSQTALTVGIYCLKNNDDLPVKIRAALENGENSSGEIGLPSFKKTERGIKKLSIFFFILLLLLPLFVSFSAAFLGAQVLLLGKTNIENRNFSLAKKEIGFSQTLLAMAKTAAVPLTLESSFIGQGNVVYAYRAKIQSLSDAATIGTYIADGLISFDKYQHASANDKEKIFQSMIDSFKHAAISMQQLSSYEGLPKELNDKIAGIEYPLQVFSETADILPKVLGFDKKMTYLVLFQNNAELRPGGGFIGSYGLLSLENGSVSDFSIHDVYDADGQLLGHKEPPFPIRRYLPSIHWYMRDSNFSFDFPTAASTSANFLSVETGQAVDGVIAVDLSVMQGLIDAVNGVYVSQYNATITKDNFFAETESHSEKNFFPGSTQKKDFLNLLFVALEHKMISQKIDYLKLLKTFGDLLQEKHILFAFASPNVQNLFTINNLSSAVWDPRVTSPGTINDFLGISEANLGVDKANYYIRRKIEQNVVFSNDGHVRESTTIQYKNLSTQWPGGGYKNYVRIIIPKGSVLKGISIDGISQHIVLAVTDFTQYERPDFIAPAGFEVATTEEFDKTAFGFLLEIPAGVLKKVTISYEFPFIASADGHSVYNDKLFKQPGTDSYPYTFSITIPKEFTVTKSSEKLSENNNTFSFNATLVTDKDIAIETARQ